MLRIIKNLFSKKEDNNEKKIKEDVSVLKDNIKESFSNLKKDMDDQKTWIDQLYQNHSQLHNFHEILKNNHDNHEKVHNKDVDNLNNWINHLHENQKNQEKHLKKVEETVKNAFGTYNRYLLDVYRTIHDMKENMRDISEKQQQDVSSGVETLTNVDRRLDASVEEGETEDMGQDTAYQLTDTNSPVAITANQQTEMLNDIRKETQDNDEGPLVNISNKLTRSEKLVLAHMMNTEQKLSYKDLSMLMNVSTSTIKNHICNMRNKGFPLKQQNSDGNIKRYYLPENMKQILISKNF